MNSKNPTCDECVEIHRALSPPRQTPCGSCPKAFLDHENEVAWELFTKMASQPRVGGMGGFLGLDFSVFPVFCEVMGIARDEWEILLEKVMVVNKVALKHWNKEDSDAN